jgi:hypothetical protein
MSDPNQPDLPAGIIHARADSAKPNMGLTNWRGAKVRKDDVTIAKNYRKLVQESIEGRGEKTGTSVL